MGGGRVGGLPVTRGFPGWIQSWAQHWQGALHLSSSSSRRSGVIFRCCFEAKGYSLILYRVAVVEAVSFQSQPLSYTLLTNPSGLFRVRQESGELSLTHPVDYESEHHLYHLLLRAMEAESTLSTVTEVRGSLHFLPTVSAILVTWSTGLVKHMDSPENLWKCSGGRTPYGAGRRLGSELGSDLDSVDTFYYFSLVLPPICVEVEEIIPLCYRRSVRKKFSIRDVRTGQQQKEWLPRQCPKWDVCFSKCRN